MSRICARKYRSGQNVVLYPYIIQSVLGQNGSTLLSLVGQKEEASFH